LLEFLINRRGNPPPTKGVYNMKLTSNELALISDALIRDLAYQQTRAGVGQTENIARIEKLLGEIESEYRTQFNKGN
jgi:hypothetical protein